MLVFDNVTLSVGNRPLFPSLSAEVSAGDTLCLVGPSGVGKSSVLNYACGFLPDDIEGAGEITLEGQAITQLPPNERQLGRLFQDALLFPHLSVAQNIAFGLAAGGSKRERLATVADALERCGLAGFEDRDPASLSGGQRARVALMQVLLAEPKALLLDEPFSALDRATRQTVRKLVFREARTRQLPVVLVTHDPDDVQAAGGRSIQLGSG
ncbi:MAG: ATP-binding cassette domain-containing protein [Pseudomonadota bacterium]